MVAYSYQFYLSFCGWEKIGKEECFDRLPDSWPDKDYGPIACIDDHTRLRYRWDDRLNEFKPDYEESGLNEVKVECINEIDPGLALFMKAFGKEVAARGRSGNRCQRASVEYILKEVAKGSE